MNGISAEATSAREAARCNDGRFGAQVHAESAIELVGAPVDVSEPDPSYDFPAWRLNDAVRSIDRANRRAERAGIPERFGYSIEKYERRSKDPLTGLDVIEERVQLTLDRPSVRHDGWTFAATLTWDEEAGMISRVAPGASLQDRPTERLCDVCGQIRDRKDTYVVQRDGVQMQVGSSCLQQFLGIRPANLWMLDFEPDVSDPDDASESSSAGHGSDRRDSTQLLALGLAVVDRYGWVSRAASADGRPATVDRVNEILDGRPRTVEVKAEFESLLNASEGLHSEAADVLDCARTLDGDSEYVHNLRALAESETVSSRNFALLLSAIGTSRRAKERAAEEKARAAQRSADAASSRWVGKVKDKVADVHVTVVSTRLIEQHFGYRPSYSTLVKMRDADGNSWKWFASGDKVDDIPVGATMTMKGTIKAHEEWEGVKETAVTRAKLEPVPDDRDRDAPDTSQP